MEKNGSCIAEWKMNGILIVMMTNYLRRLLPFAFTPGIAMAGEEAAVPLSMTPQPSWAWTLDAGYLHQQETDLDDGGAFSVDRANIAVGAKYSLGRGDSVGIGLEYGYHDYSFDGMKIEPWGKIHALTLSAPIRRSLNSQWSLFALPSVRANYEDGASISDAVTGGLLAGASYKLSERLYIGPGFGISSELEDDLNLFPILLIRWQINDELMLKTGRGMGASQGPGLVLDWQASEKWKLSLGARYEKLRFRLSDRNFIPDGVGEDSGVPVYLGASYKFSDTAELSLYMGMKFAGSLELEDSSGDSLYDTDYDTAPFFGVSWSSRF